MLCLLRTERDPYFNIAAEEYVLKNFRHDVFMLWQNNPCIVIGKHQNLAAEVNARFAFENKIPVIRRISGGGAVYHDPGNINYSFIVYGEKDKLVDYRKYTAPVLGFLKQHGINAEFEGKSNLVINGNKFSGNSAHVFRNKIVHHGTLLFNSNIENLKEAVKASSGTYRDKAVRSIRSHVCNLQSYFPENYSIENFISELIEYIRKLFNAEIYVFNASDVKGINELAKSRYGTWEWNYGYSPDYSYTNKFSINNDDYLIELSASKGLIQNILIKKSGSDFSLSSLENQIKGKTHQYPVIYKTLQNTELVQYIPGISIPDLTSKFF